METFTLRPEVGRTAYYFTVLGRPFFLKGRRMKKTQSDKILSYLQRGHHISPIQALNKFGCFRLAARIHDLRKKGYNIASESRRFEYKTVVYYSLVV